MKRLLLFFLAFYCNALALDLTIKDGTVFHNIRLREIDAKGIMFLHDEGVASIDYMRLNEQDRVTFGYVESKYSPPAARAAAPSPPATQAGTTAPNYTPQPATTAPRATAPASPSVRSSGQCQATTKKGYQCTRNAASGSSYCWQHGR